MTNEAMTEIMMEIVKLMCNDDNVLLPHQITSPRRKERQRRLEHQSEKRFHPHHKSISFFLHQYKLDHFFNLFLSQYKLDPTPEPSDEDIESSSDEEDGFGGGKKKEEEDEDPAASNDGDEFQLNVVWKTRNLMPMTHTCREKIFKRFSPFSEAKAMAEKAQKEALEMAQSKCVLQ